MVLTPLKGLLFAAGAVIAGAGAAYLAGAFDPYLENPPAPLVATPQSDGQVAPATGEEAAQKAARLQDDPSAQTQAQTPAPAATTQPDVTAPTFDVVRVEPDGSMVVAGRAAPNATVEIVHGATVLGTATSGPGGDFAAVLEDPLKPGDYQIVLRATTPDNVAATSVETAIVTVPDNEAGQVLALVDRPGAPSRLITVPEAAPAKDAERQVAAASETVAPTEAPTGQEAAPATEEPAQPEQAARAETGSEPGPQAAPQAAPVQETPARTTPAQTAPAATQGAVPNIEAVEIDGRQVFVAGAAAPGSPVRVYANEILLGQTLTLPNGRFLIEAVRDLPVGDYIVRADMLSADGRTVVARAAVPFTRAEGEQLAAVAPQVESASKTERLPAEAGQPAAAPEEPAAGGDKPGTVAATEPAAAAKLAPVDGSVIIRRGDTLWQISRRVYGRGVRYTTIYLANRGQIENPDRIWPGQVFAVPETTQEGEPADMQAIGGQAAPEAPASTAQ
ncbi:LysM peptidoglycan-binding domain-containing protein [Nitratireductor soli]|uniref:LysM peptidoglycan-binding domain-containing protein n=1 Tax=Nitratireductor soli TaxID=1670619 RepID=UPI00065E9567|nr:LysM peptidoglycan-binding domain-containing protein [Nitratireductor soli]